MTVTLHLPASPTARSAMLRRLITLAGNPKAVRSGNGGLIVSDDLALAYLAADQPTASDGHLSHPAPPDLARVVRDTEVRSGLLEGRPEIAEPAPPPRTRTAARRPRRITAQQGAPQ